MEKGIKKQGYLVIFLDRERFDVYESVNGNIFSFPFSTNIINGLELLNPSEFQNQVSVFIDQNQINPADIIMIVSARSLFEKDIYTTGMEQEQIDEASKNFLSTVPFDLIYSKTIPFQGGIRISATNRTLCDGINYAFEKKGSSINAIIPYESLGEEFSTITSLDINSATYVVKNFDSLKSQAFSDEEKEKKVQNPKTESQVKNATQINSSSIVTTEKPSKTRIYLLGGVFVILIGILAYLILNPPA